MLGRVDAADARGRALADVAEQARAADLPRALEDSGRAGPDRKDPEQGVNRVPDRPGMRVRPEIPDTAALGPAHDLHPREFLVHGDGQIRVALVVAVADVEP